MEIRQRDQCFRIRGKPAGQRVSVGGFPLLWIKIFGIPAEIGVFFCLRPDPGSEGNPACAGIGAVNQQPAAGIVIIRGDAYIPDVQGGYLLQPYGLPDPALGRIKHTAPIQLLFAPAVQSGVGGIFCKNGQLKLAGILLGKQPGDVQREGKISAGMPAGFLSVNQNPALLVHRAEVQKKPPSLLRKGKQNPAPVPEKFTGLKLPSHSGQGAFRGEGYQNAALHFIRDILRG